MEDMAKGHFSSLIILTDDYSVYHGWVLEKCGIVLHIPKPANYKHKSQGNNKKNKTLSFLVPMSKQHLISCSDDFQSMKLDQIKSHSFLQHSTLSLTQQVFFLSLLYEVVVNNLEKW